MSRVDLPGLAASKQAASKQQASKQHARNGQKSELRRGASYSAEILVDDTYGCEVQSHKVGARNSTVAAGNGDSQMADRSFKNYSLGPKTASFGPKKALEHIQNGQTKGNDGYTPCAA